MKMDSFGLIMRNDVRICAGKKCGLTPIEYKLLCLLAQNTGKVLTHKFILQNVWGRSLESDVGSLRVFMATLRKKTRKSTRFSEIYSNAYRHRVSNASN